MSPTSGRRLILSHKAHLAKRLKAAQSISPAARDVIEWHRLRAGEGELTEYEAFLKRRSDWPGLPYLKG